MQFGFRCHYQTLFDGSSDLVVGILAAYALILRQAVFRSLDSWIVLAQEHIFTRLIHLKIDGGSLGFVGTSEYKLTH